AGDLDLEFLHAGLPRRRLEAVWRPAADRTAGRDAPALSLAEELLSLLARPDVRSKEAVIRRYDHEVQAATAVKPLVGPAGHGPSDAAVLVPLDRQSPAGGGALPAVALANGICPAVGQIDPYLMAWAAVDEAMRNLTAAGADPDRVALLDNFCWGNPSLPDRLGGLVRCSLGCHDAAVAYQAPYISGKDSLNNEYTGADGAKQAIPGTLLISALGYLPDVRRAVTMDAKAAGDHLYLLGDFRSWILDGALSGRPAFEGGLALLRGLHAAITAGLVAACHDLSEGGLGVALAEMCLAGRLGAEVALAAIPAGPPAGERALLFGEGLTRLLVEVRPDAAADFERLLASQPLARIGRLEAGGQVRINGLDGREQLSLPLVALESAWRGEAAEDEPPAAPAGPARSPNSGAVIEAPSIRRPKRALILHANGANRDREAALACEAAGGQAEIVHINQLLAAERRLEDYHLLVLPGGFSYGDDLGAGNLLALDLRARLGDAVARFISSGRPVLGICNGFQALVKAGLLPGADGPAGRQVTLAPNCSGRFECRWVYLRPNPASPCLFTQGLEELIYCPVAHGEGRLAAADEGAAAALAARGLVALSYVDAAGRPAGYPANPNGSALDISGLCNPAGNVLGLMPHPEDHIFAWQHPRWTRGEGGLLGLRLFENGLKRA
ncbi:MAG: phosphoribosylformylglycinamidine synthase I, partial [Candidatus Promineifilaceae bacterium]